MRQKVDKGTKQMKRDNTIGKLTKTLSNDTIFAHHSLRFNQTLFFKSCHVRATIASCKANLRQSQVIIALDGLRVQPIYVSLLANSSKSTCFKNLQSRGA